MSTTLDIKTMQTITYNALNVTIKLLYVEYDGYFIDFCSSTIIGYINPGFNLDC